MNKRLVCVALASISVCFAVSLVSGEQNIPSPEETESVRSVLQKWTKAVSMNDLDSFCATVSFPYVEVISGQVTVTNKDHWRKLFHSRRKANIEENKKELAKVGMADHTVAILKGLSEWAGKVLFKDAEFHFISATTCVVKYEAKELKMDGPVEKVGPGPDCFVTLVKQKDGWRVVVEVRGDMPIPSAM